MQYERLEISVSANNAQASFTAAAQRFAGEILKKFLICIGHRQPELTLGTSVSRLDRPNVYNTRVRKNYAKH
jgi:hypothetical protein